MLACWREGVVPLLQLHDCLDCSVSSRDQAELVARLGCEAVQLDVPMRVDLKFGRNWGDAKHTWEELQGQPARPMPATMVETTTGPINDYVDKTPTSDPRDKPQPTTQRDIDEINVGLMREGIEPLHFNAAPERTMPPPWEGPAQAAFTPVAMESDGPTLSPEANIPPPDFDDPPPRSGGNGSAGNGSDGYNSGEAPRGAPTDRYVYKDGRGQLYMRVIRTSGKTFPTQHWQGGKWVNGWPATVIPYRLPELLAAPLS
jgi:hypothetical protein